MLRKKKVTLLMILGFLLLLSFSLYYNLWGKSFEECTNRCYEQLLSCTGSHTYCVDQYDTCMEICVALYPE